MDSYGVVGTIVPYIIFLHSHQILVFVEKPAPSIYFGYMFSIGINHSNNQI